MVTTADKIAMNKVFFQHHGWDGLGEVVPGAKAIDADFVAKLGLRQRDLSVGMDGICGPATYSAILATQQADLRELWKPDNKLATPDVKLAAAGEIAMLEIKRLWLRNISDLPAKTAPDYETCRSTIDQLIRTQLGIGWGWLPEYERDHFEFCGTGPAYGWRAAGMPLKPHRFWFFASTDRLNEWGAYRRWEDTPNPLPPAGVAPRMMIKLDENTRPRDVKFPDGTIPRAGDIVIVGMCESGPGTHIATAEFYDAVLGAFTTLECNGGSFKGGTALAPTGRPIHGIVRATRRIGLNKGDPRTTYHVRRIIRPSLADLSLPL